MDDYKNNEQLYLNLLAILKLFKNRPYHLAKYLIENDALNDSFINKIIDSERLSNLSQVDEGQSVIKTVYFIDISHMNEYFNDLTDKPTKSKPVKKDMSKDLNFKLDQALKEERYEDAIRIRDYMIKHNIKRNFE